MPTIATSTKGQGNAHSPWGAKGGPAGKARQRIIDAMRDRLK